MQSFFQEISSTDFNLLINRAKTNKKSESLLVKDTTKGSIGAVSASEMMSRSALRHTVQHT
jgi:hypothetical protein